MTRIRPSRLLTIASLALVLVAVAPGIGAGLPGTATASHAAPAASGIAQLSAAFSWPPQLLTLGDAEGMRPGNFYLHGLLHGLFGAGLLGLAAGRGFFSALANPAGVLGILLQLAMLAWLGAWLFRRTALGLIPVGGTAYTRFLHPGLGSAAPILRRNDVPQDARTPLAISDLDVRAFEELLHCMQAAWCAHDLQALQSMVTETMAEAYGEQIASQQARGEHDVVSALTVKRREVRDAWSESHADFAHVVLRYTMLDTTVDHWGRVMRGSATEPVMLTEQWNFIRAARRPWLVYAIEQSN